LWVVAVKRFVKKKFSVMMDHMRCTRKMKAQLDPLEPAPRPHDKPVPAPNLGQTDINCSADWGEETVVMQARAGDIIDETTFPDIKAVRADEAPAVKGRASSRKKLRLKALFRFGSKTKAVVTEPAAATAAAMKRAVKAIDTKVTSAGTGLKKMGRSAVGKAASMRPRFGCLASLKCLRPKALE